MAEQLPGLIDPNLPPDQQPLNDTSNPNPVSRPPAALHPDRFTPGNAATPNLPAAAGRQPGRSRPAIRPRRRRSLRRKLPRAARAQRRPRRRKGRTASHVRASARDAAATIEIHRYPVLVYALVPLAALVLQAGCRACWAGTPGSICRWWSPSILRWAGAARSRDAHGRAWASLKTRSRTTPSASTASPRRWSASGRVGRRAHRCGESHHPAGAQLSAVAGVERDLLLRGSLPAGHVDLESNWLTELYQGHWQLADRAGAVSAARPVCRFGTREFAISGLVVEDSQLSTLVQAMKRRLSRTAARQRAEFKIEVS